MILILRTGFGTNPMFIKCAIANRQVKVSVLQ